MGPKSGMPAPIKTGTRVMTKRSRHPAAKKRWIVMPPSTYACWKPRASSRCTMAGGSPDICSTGRPATRERSSERLLNTTTGF